MKCNHCGNEISDQAERCPYCHTPILRIRPKHVCPNCGTEVPDTMDHCPGCGKTVRRSASEGTNGSERSHASKHSGLDTYAWLQAIVPMLVATLYHFSALHEHPGFNLVNTLLLFEGLTIFFGYLDVRTLSGRIGYGSEIMPHSYIVLSYVLPAYSMWQRRELPGMKKTALYPVVSLLLFTIFFFIVLFFWNATRYA